MNRYAVSLVYTQLIGNGNVKIHNEVSILASGSKEEALGKCILMNDEQFNGWQLSNKVVVEVTTNTITNRKRETIDTRPGL